MEADVLITPTAMQLSNPGHDTLAREFSPDGATCEFQSDPSVVLTMTDPPTAVQTDTE
jgi:hypothetical protein